MVYTNWCKKLQYGSYLPSINIQVLGLDPYKLSTSQDAIVKSVESFDTILESSSLTSIDKEQTYNSDIINTQPHNQCIHLPPLSGKYISPKNYALLNVGGPVWAMDWLPLSKDVENSNIIMNSWSNWRILALSAHPPCELSNDGEILNTNPPDHYYDKQEIGSNAIQLWAIPRDILSQGETQQPKLISLLTHSHGVAWDMKWHPNLDKVDIGNKSNVLGLLAVCFGDGSIQVLEIPSFNTLAEAEKIVEDIPVSKICIAKGILQRIIHLSIDWSVINPYQLLTGESDGSISLWNLDCMAINNTKEVNRSEKWYTDLNKTIDLEPQRRFMDVDAIGKQEAFEWGRGWVAVRAVAWSPFDKFIFASTGNDSMFKVWDIREPRACLRSHRIRSTWGLSLKWVDCTSVVISGDQGNVYLYDVLSGSNQKLHFHPQIDSPIWDVVEAPTFQDPLLLVSCCASGSIRIAPAKRGYRIANQAIEICKFSTENNEGPNHASTMVYDNQDTPKKLTIDFRTEVIQSSSETVATSVRKFCDRDLALHCVRLNSFDNINTYKSCVAAVGGHSGCVLLMEIQEILEQAVSEYFLHPQKKIGRSKGCKGITAEVAGLRKSSPVNSSLNTYYKKQRAQPNALVKSISLANTQQKNTNERVKKRQRKQSSLQSLIVDVKQVAELQLSDEEAEAQTGNDDSSETDASLISLHDEESDVQARDVSSSDESLNEQSEEETHETRRLRAEYQLDLSEDEALRLALQLSEVEINSKGANHFDDITSQPPLSKKPLKISTPPILTQQIVEPKKNTRDTKDNIRSGTIQVVDDNEKLIRSMSTTMEKTARSTSNNGSKRTKSSRIDLRKSTNNKALNNNAYLDMIQAEEKMANDFQLGLSEKDAMREAIHQSKNAASQGRRSSRPNKVSQKIDSNQYLEKGFGQTIPVASRTGSTAPSSIDFAVTSISDACTQNNKIKVKNIEGLSTNKDIHSKANQNEHDGADVMANVSTQENRQITIGKKFAIQQSYNNKEGNAKLSRAQKRRGKSKAKINAHGKVEKIGKTERLTQQKSKVKPNKKRNKRNQSQLWMTEDDLIAMALKTSEIEY